MSRVPEGVEPYLVVRNRIILGNRRRLRHAVDQDSCLAWARRLAEGAYSIIGNQVVGDGFVDRAALEVDARAYIDLRRVVLSVCEQPDEVALDCHVWRRYGYPVAQRSHDAQVQYRAVGSRRRYEKEPLD